MTNSTSDQETFDVIVEREFVVPVERLWNAWADAEEVKKWWGPRGFTCPIAHVDLREGGRTFVAMQAPAEYGGGLVYNAWDFAEVVPLSRLTYVIRFTDSVGTALSPADLGLPPGIPDAGVHEVDFTRIDENRSRMRMVEHGYTRSETRDLSRDGLEQCLDKMAESFAG